MAMKNLILLFLFILIPLVSSISDNSLFIDEKNSIVINGEASISGHANIITNISKLIPEENQVKQVSYLPWIYICTLIIIILILIIVIRRYKKDKKKLAT